MVTSQHSVSKVGFVLALRATGEQDAIVLCGSQTLIQEKQEIAQMCTALAKNWKLSLRDFQLRFSYLGTISTWTPRSEDSF